MERFSDKNLGKWKLRDLYVASNIQTSASKNPIKYSPLQIKRLLDTPMFFIVFLPVFRGKEALLLNQC